VLFRSTQSNAAGADALAESSAEIATRADALKTAMEYFKI